MNRIGTRLAIATVLGLLTSIAIIAQSPSKGFTGLYAKSGKLQLRPFHSMWVCGFEADADGDRTRSDLTEIFNRFQEDFDAFRRFSKDPEILGFRPVPPPNSELILPRNDSKRERQANEKKPVFKADVENAVKRLSASVKKDDVVFVYVITHGDDRTLKFQGGDIDREALRQDLRQLTERENNRARLVVLIVDACSGKIAADTPERTEPLSGGAVWRSLYFGLKGFVEVTSTTPGETGFRVGGRSVFLEAFNRALSSSSIPGLKGNDDMELRNAFVKALDKKPKRGDGEVGDGVVTWDEFVPHLQVQVTKVFDEFMKTRGIKPKDLALMQDQKKEQEDNHRKILGQTIGLRNEESILMPNP